MVPIQFEYVDSNYSFKEEIEVHKFVVVLDMFRHHYSGTTMYHVRVDYTNPYTLRSVSEYLTYSEDEMTDILKTRVKED